ncbi:hypothetical protein SAPIO_CDS7743 [Scedosporium apiospermum]|uniref:Uncharacterized protein n=1 Tax=Pseudallescheria apiosperma TaxID=563466 RepID=A0A084G2L1_PSEDA|nr:uncharacterized protein SAPIO_CDS7743 [Scedosporium apiospermum]KEZ41573.1 hypothetical protein SAPIO_CDS7743 [Scedosporium apiospermum]
MSFLAFDNNISFYTVPAALFLAFIPHAYAVSLGISRYDPGNPRKFEATVSSDSTLNKVIKNRILRAKAASTNSFETLGLYAAAVVAGNLVQVDKDTLNYLTALYIISRALYVFTYVWLQDNRAFSPLRTVFWGAGIWSIVSLFIKAGNAVA